MKRPFFIGAFALVSCGTEEPKQEIAQPTCVVDWAVYDETKTEIYPRNVVTVQRSGAVMWNGVRISKRQLYDFLNVSWTFEPKPLALLRFEKSSTCDERAQVIETMKKSPLCNNFCMRDGIAADSEIEPENLEF